MSPREVDRQGTVTLDVGGSIVYVSAYADSTYEGRRIARGRYYDVSVQGGGPMRSMGLIDAADASTFYSFSPVTVGRGLGRQVRTFDEAIRVLDGVA
ncbi:hypothetical protein [Rathayibacter sp. VKM Ac-2857]|uniref:hypothetical protein n=1 Tax=Rathayibacter sp. VKM Ac-2857 TaxID=2739020 RepID=UPI001564C6E9|nr:hypothetical protein [Rathayibacter sp. VKM Ac-2857]NQX15086.1 hypothetical protein [Rathayibacter sp. VKM Ac-2857]